MLEFVIHHIYIKACPPRLNGKVELFHKTDDVKFYKMLSHTEDVVNIVAVLNHSRGPVKGPFTSYWSASYNYFSWSVFGVMMMSIRLLMARPSWVALDAKGRSDP